jgi:hypothetical protein
MKKWYFKRLSSSGSGNKWVLHFDHLVSLAKSMIRKCICNNLNKIFAWICTFLTPLVIQNLKKTSHFGMIIWIIFRRNFWAKGWSVVGQRAPKRRPSCWCHYDRSYCRLRWRLTKSTLNLLLLIYLSMVRRSFLMVVVSGRTTLGMVRNEHLKMGIF